MVGKASGVVGREGARRNGFVRLASVAVVGVVGLGVVGALSACSSDPATKPAAMSTPVTPTVTVTSTRPAASATSSAPATTATTSTRTSTTATATPTATAIASATATATRTVAPVGTSGSSGAAAAGISSLTGTWLVHDLVVEIHADGTGQLRSWGCYPGTVMVCQVVSDVTVTPVGASGARLTVVRTFALDENGHVAPVPAGVDLAQQKQQVGDYSVLQPFTAATWPYSTPLTTASQRAVYSFLSASKGQPLGDPKNELARMCRTTGSNPPRAVDPTYCGA